MLKQILITTSLLLVAIPSWGGNKTTRIYDAKGHEVAKVRETDVNYQMYDKDDHYLGRVTKNIDGSRTAWSRDGKYLGHSTTVGGDEEHNEDGEE